MAEVLLFHHAPGQAAGLLTLADETRAAVHTVHAPDLRGVQAAARLPNVAFLSEVG